ncbi:hypothetical protein FB451DRAFT_1132966 [Mycena latifolia]|nr:hypothetical protein FB451DRAFT_1132966 [Mycena latifolia]
METPANILTTSSTASETRLTAQSSHLFQNAAGFEIVGGQFVLGDVHNHPVMDQSRHTNSISNTPDDSDGYSESEIYCSQLLRRKRGFPLWVPGPQRNLPAEYQRKGVAIGDLGRVTPEGVFDFFFNIYLPADHPINANDVPEDFVPLKPYVSKDVVHLDFDPGSHVSSSFIHELDPDAASSSEFPGGEFLFNCKGPNGALLALPHGAHLEKLESVEHARRYAAQNAQSWYKYVNGTRGRGLVNGTLYLITGCEKALSGGMASFENVVAGAQFQLSFKPTNDAGYTYHFKRGTPARTKMFSSWSQTGECLLNHTTFLHGFTISLGEGIWGRLFGNVGISQITDSQLRKSHSDFVPFSSQGSLFSWSFGFFGGGGTTGGKKYSGQNGEDTTISDLSPSPEIFHPGQLINGFILREAPDAKVVITHDDDWRDILYEDGPGSPIQDASEFFGQVMQQFNITMAEEDGTVFLRSRFGGFPIRDVNDSPKTFIMASTSRRDQDTLAIEHAETDIQASEVMIMPHGGSAAYETVGGDGRGYYQQALLPQPQNHHVEQLQLAAFQAQAQQSGRPRSYKETMREVYAASQQQTAASAAPPSEFRRHFELVPEQSIEDYLKSGEPRTAAEYSVFDARIHTSPQEGGTKRARAEENMKLQSGSRAQSPNDIWAARFKNPEADDGDALKRRYHIEGQEEGLLPPSTSKMDLDGKRRRRKAMLKQQLEESVEGLTREKEIWKARTQAITGILESHGITPPDFNKD